MSATKTLSERRSPRKGSELPQHAKLFVAFECERPAAGSLRLDLSHVDEIVLGRGSDRGVELRSGSGGLRLMHVHIPDPWMSSTHARLVHVMGCFVLEDLGSRNGTVINGVAQTRCVLVDGDLIELGHTLLLFRAALPTEPDEPEVFDSSQLTAASPGLVTLLCGLSRQFAALSTLAPSPVTVLLRGESGTGKEVMARALHHLSRRPGEFVAVNCGALPENLLESELFGHRKGAFTGAHEERTGLVRAADGGTLFLDEIGDLPLPSQAALLRVLQECEVIPIGATRPVKVDLRLVAATNRNLEIDVASGEFRADLLARITGFTLTLPPLRKRREDFALLVHALLSRHHPSVVGTIRFSQEAARALYRYSWPLNVRELEKVLSTAVVLAGGECVELEHLPPVVLDAGPVIDMSDRPAISALTAEEQRHRDELALLLREHRGNVSAVARSLGKARMQVHRWIRRYRLRIKDFR